MPSFIKKNWVDATFLIFFLMCVIGLFFLEIKAIGPITERERGLFNALEFGSAIGIGWLFQRIASKEEFQKSLKQFALSAYKRINDINKSVERLSIEIDKIRTNYPKEKCNELDVLSSISVLMNYTVQSSISDWSDIIGEEVRKIERIEELQNEKLSLETRLNSYLNHQESSSANKSHITQRLVELKQEIEELRPEIPSALRYELQFNRDLLPREGRLSEFVLSHFSIEILSHSIVTLRVIPRTDAGIDIHTGPFWIASEQAMSQLHAVIYDKDNNMIGVIDNPFPEIYTNDYIYSTLSLLATITSLTSSIDEPIPVPIRICIREAKINRIPHSTHRLIQIPATDDVLTRG